LYKEKYLLIQEIIMKKSSIQNTYQTAVITKIEQETPIVKSFYLDTKVKAKPGQYVMVWIPRVNEKPFGVASTNPFMLSIANIGSFTQKVHELKVGDKLSWRGPYGTSFTLKGEKLLIVAGGYGVVPLHLLASQVVPEKRKNITVIIGAKTAKHLPFVDKFKELGCKVKVATDDGSKGFKGFTTKLAQELLGKETFDQAYTCGPNIMMETLAQVCHKHDLPCQVSFEAFFKCGGLGLCGECNYKGHLVCQEGPVFDSSLLLK
jgi:dihydroorotate dehydrogenase electron transfer subunit